MRIPFEHYPNMKKSECSESWERIVPERLTDWGLFEVFRRRKEIRKVIDGHLSRWLPVTAKWGKANILKLT